MTTRHDLLSDALLSWRARGRQRHAATLPGVLAALARGEVMDFPRARAHQQDPWSMFLTQLAAIAMRRGGIDVPPVAEGDWMEPLLALTEGRREPWCLVVEDLLQPAFFQPPVPEGSLCDRKGRPWNSVQTPDDLDMLVTSKGHDVKTGLVSPEDAELWTYALCTLQTMQGYPGRGYKEIARMNGAYGSRPRVGMAVGVTPGERFNRDLAVMLEEWPKLLERGLRDDGVALVWCHPWDGKASLALGDLAPHFIEVCQRVRLVMRGQKLVAMRTTSEVRRCAPEIDGGDVGDVWCPVDRERGTVLTAGSGGYHYRLLVELLFGGGYEAGPAQRVRPEDPERIVLCAGALARGQGKTEGLHERVVPISGAVRRALLRRPERDVLAARAEARVKQAGEMRSKVLFPALRRLALGETAPRDSLDARVDERFFDSLFGSLGLDDDAARALWEDELVALAGLELDLAIARAALSDASYWRRTTAAREDFFRCLAKRFPDARQRMRDRAMARRRAGETA